MNIDIHVSLYAYAAANGCAIKFVIDLRGRAWREGKEEGERFISKSLINSATCKVRVTKIKGKTKEKGTAYVHVSFLHSQISTHTGTEERDCFCQPTVTKGGFPFGSPDLLFFLIDLLSAGDSVCSRENLFSS